MSLGKTILIADDERVLRESLAGLLEPEGFTVLQAENGRQAHEMLLAQPVDLVVSDVRMPEMDGLTLLAHIAKLAPETPVIVMTAFGTVDSAVQAMRAGARDYLLKPVQFDDLLVKIQRALEFSDLSRDRRVITEQLAAPSSFQNIVSQAPPMLKLFEQVRKLSTVKSSVLIVGESGTGKELFARAIHYNGATRTKPFVAVNCGAIPESLIESELFGHRKGTFTGAIRDKVGYFEAANGGTLFLDEISTLPKNVQSSMLRVLEERAVVPVGDTHPRPIDLRVIAASNQDLEEMIRQGEFREDLLFRLNVVKLVLPPLRQRPGDIPLLVHHFLAKYSAEMGKNVSGLTNGAMRALLSHEWRGNVRELENTIERAVIFAEGGEVRVEDLPFAAEQADNEAGEDLKEALRQFERQHILHSLRRHDYDKTETARHLGIGVSSLYRKLDELDIPKNDEDDASSGPPASSSTAVAPAPPPSGGSG
ncbi:MAG: sigma-54-dependent Fis family transcriptional regulator [Phycisphaerales bacterium]|nr:sigma-54-dependent Fis family transcriptional regulator [Phycisphaerales bacterium]